MLTRMQNTFRTIGEYLHHSKTTRTSTFNFHERTELTWAKVIESYDRVPDAYRPFFASLPAERPFPYTVFTPAFETLGYRITEKIICVLEEEIHVLERIGKGLADQCYALADISYVESSRMLLDSRVKISGITKQGITTSSLARFSSATDYIFAPVVRKIRLYGIPSKDLNRKRDVENFEPWMNLNFKFMNMARQSLFGGESVVHALLQPEIRKPIFTFWGKTCSKMIAPTQAVILTDRELIVIREDAQHSRKDRYGGIWQYIPLRKIATFNMDYRTDGLLTLSIQLITGEHFEYLFQSSTKDEFELLLSRVGKTKNDR